MNRAAAFGRASWVMGQLDYTALSFEFYNRDPRTLDFDALNDELTHRYSLVVPSPGTHDWASFGHLGGYSSAYYTYLYDKVIAEDFMTQFDRGDLFSPAPALRYRQTILEPGGSVSANDLVKNFLGRTQNMTALKDWMGEEFTASGSN
jgi:thimet oligopeptidase